MFESLFARDLSVVAARQRRCLTFFATKSRFAMRLTRTGVARAALGISRVSTHAMGSKKRARHDSDAPMPEMRDQGGLAAVARDVARRAAAVDGGGDEGRDGNEAKKAKKAKKEKKEKKASKEKEKRRDMERDESVSRRRDVSETRGGKPGGREAPRSESRESRELRRDASFGEGRFSKKNRRGADDASAAALRRLAGDDAADDAIVREHAVNDGKRAKRANDADDAPASTKIVEAARRLDAVVDAASRVVFVSAPEVSAVLEVEPELDERLFKAFGMVAARCASLAKRCAQKNAALLGGSRVGASHAASGFDASRALAEEMRVDRSSSFGPSRVLRVYESSKLWDAVKKHNAVVWGRALAACEASEKAVLLKKKSSLKEDERTSVDDDAGDDASEDVFASFYRAAVVDAHAEDLEQLRVSGAKHGDVADVGVLLRAIQSGADVVPALQKALAVQFASLKAFAAEGRTGKEKGDALSGSETGSETDATDASDADADADGSPRLVDGGKKRSARLRSKRSKSGSDDDDARGSDSAFSDSSSDDAVSAGGDDEVDYAVTPVAH